MQQYIILAVFIRFVVDFLLLFAVNRLFSPFSGFLPALLGAAAGVVYAVGCTVPKLTFLQGNLWYAGSILLCSLIAFGRNRSGFSAGAVYCILRLALDGLASGKGAIAELLIGASLSGLFLLGFGGNGLCKRYVPVELRYGNQTVQIQALWDTGHDLQDPVTGRSVLVVGADVANRLIGLEQSQLMNPVETMGTILGLRLVSYQTVEQAGCMMLAMMIPDTKIGKRKGPVLVAFAPQILDGNGKFQALIGGRV